MTVYWTHMSTQKQNKKHTVTLSSQQREQLHAITSKGEHKARTIKRARILLESARGISAADTALVVDTDPRTVERVRQRFREGGLDRALYDAPRPGAPVILTNDVEAYLVATACSTPPETEGRWTLELLRDKLKQDKNVRVSASLIGQRLSKRGIKPWREKNVVYSGSDA